MRWHIAEALLCLKGTIAKDQIVFSINVMSPLKVNNYMPDLSTDMVSVRSGVRDGYLEPIRLQSDATKTIC